MKNLLFSKLLMMVVIFNLNAACYSQEKEELIRNWVFPERSANTNSILIDLTNYYTAALDDDWLVSAGANLKKLHKGVTTFNNVAFDIRGVIQLGGIDLYAESDYSIEDQKKHYPEKVTGIQINQKTSEIYFLHASAWGEAKNKEIGQYVINYEDGSSEKVSLKYMDAFRDWWFMPNDEMPSNATIAWTGLNDLTEKKGYHIRLFTYTWKNPTAQKTIKTIDFISTMTTASPFLIAITLGE
jgi:hypothetical protein